MTRSSVIQHHSRSAPARNHDVLYERLWRLHNHESPMSTVGEDFFNASESLPWPTTSHLDANISRDRVLPYLWQQRARSHFALGRPVSDGRLSETPRSGFDERSSRSR